jgi:hypothetical protein
MNPPDQLLPLIKLGLFRSVDILSSFSVRPTTRTLLTRAKALVELRKFPAAIRTLDSIKKGQRTEDEVNEILELKFMCYFANQNTATGHCAALLPTLANRRLTPKLHIFAAEAHILEDATHSPTHPAVPHLLEVLRLYPTAIELAEKLLLVISSIDFVLSHISSGSAKLFMQSLQFAAHSEFDRATFPTASFRLLHVR